MSELTREDILECNDANVQKLSVPEWGEGKYVWLRALSGKERDWFEDTITKIAERKGAVGTKLNLRGEFASLVISDSNGNKIFNPKDANALGEKSATALDRILVQGMKHSALTEESHKEAEDFFLAVPNKDSGSN